MRWTVKSIAKFLIVLVSMTIVCTIAWQFVGERFYDCTDDDILGYLRPGGWVHVWDNHPIVAVHQIVHNRSMSEPDTIKEGWSVTRLWGLWFSFFAVSFFISLLLARVPWIPRRRIGIKSG